jgi:protein phosphatase
MTHGDSSTNLPGGSGDVAGNSFQVVDPTQPADQEKAIMWWQELTSGGGEGMVVKPF